MISMLWKSVYLGQFWVAAAILGVQDAKKALPESSLDSASDFHGASDLYRCKRGSCVSQSNA